MGEWESVDNILYTIYLPIVKVVLDGVYVLP